jgi:hypothetical protein
MKSINIIDKTTRGMGIRLHSDLEYTGGKKIRLDGAPPH